MYLAVSNSSLDDGKHGSAGIPRTGMQPLVEVPPQLSPRMLSCLMWASQGKSSVDIGQLLKDVMTGFQRP